MLLHSLATTTTRALRDGRLLSLAAVLLSAGMPVGFAQTDEARSAPSAEYRAPVVNAEPAARLKSATAAPALSLTLDPPSAAELAELHEPGAGKGYRIGIGRVLPEPWSTGHAFDRLAKTILSDGGRTSRLSVTSPGARGLRLQLRYGVVPKGVELRFYNPDRPGEVHGPVSSVQLARHLEDLRRVGELGEGEQALYWSPLVDGERIAVEIYFPPGIAPGRLQLATPMLSHLVASPNQGRAGFGLPKDLLDLGNSDSCNIDVACVNNLSPSTVNSVGKFLYTTAAGATSLCTGTLLNTSPVTFVPYFLTARHCISNQTLAGSTEFFWFFQRAACASPELAPFVAQPGGATLRSVGVNNDFALLEIRSPPPDGVGFSGWNTATVTAGTATYGLHHPRGDVKKYSSGAVLGFEPASAPADGIALPSSLVVRWSEGITEPGSSGSGLFVFNAGAGLQLVGTLSLGSSFCSAPGDPDSYGRFDQMFPILRRFLVLDKPTPGPGSGITRLLNISAQARVNSAGMQAGFIVTGTGNKRFVVLAEDSGGGDGLRNPTLRLIDLASGQTIDSNDNWRTHPTAAEITASLNRSPATEFSAGLAVTLAPGVYAALVDGANGSTGRALVGVQEIRAGTAPRLLNISTQGFVSSAGMQAGFIITGSGSKRLVILAEDSGGGDGLRDPVLQLVDLTSGRLLDANDDWPTHPAAGEIAARSRPAVSEFSSGLAITLPPGVYAALVSGFRNGVGRALISVQELN